jgi:hypothetical protein
LLRLAQRRASEASVPVALMRGTATAMPLSNDSIDTLVMTGTPEAPVPALSKRSAIREPFNVNTASGRHSIGSGLIQVNSQGDLNQLPCRGTIAD